MAALRPPAFVKFTPGKSLRDDGLPHVHIDYEDLPGVGALRRHKERRLAYIATASRRDRHFDLTMDANPSSGGMWASAGLLSDVCLTARRRRGDPADLPAVDSWKNPDPLDGATAVVMPLFQ
jgi:hypothetical protein